jgi:uncharacterized protein
MTPIRTCVGCGARAPKDALTRFVATADGLALDLEGRVPGRGAYLHSALACRAAFVRRRGPVRSLRQTPERAERERLAAALAEASAGG